MKFVMMQCFSEHTQGGQACGRTMGELIHKSQIKFPFWHCRARYRETGEICALKKVKLEKERDGFPLTSVREINILLSLNHPNIVNVSEVRGGGKN